MKSIFYLLLIFLAVYTVSAQAQLPTVQNLELPTAYETWQGGTEKLDLRADLVAEKESRILLVASGTSKSVRISKVNSAIVFVVVIESNDDQVQLTLYWLTTGGYAKFSGDIRRPTKESEDQVDTAWKVWDKYMREKYNINDLEMDQLERFLEL